MGVKEDIEKMYENLYNSKVTDLQKQKEEALLQLANRENGINNQYTNTENEINKNRKDTQSAYLDRYTQLDKDLETGKKKFYGDRDNAAISNSKNTQAIRDYMAKANLIQSGESVDALLRQQTDFTNTKNSIYSQENEYTRNIDNTRSQYKRDESSAYEGFNNQLATALRDKDQNLAAILAERGQAEKSYNSGLSSAKSEVDYNKLKELNDYNKLLEDREYQAKLLAEERAYQEKLLSEERAYNERMAAASRAASYSSGSSGSSRSSSSSSSSAISSKDLKAQFKDLMANKNTNYQAQNFLKENKDSLIEQYGYAFYKDLDDTYWNDIGDYYAAQAKKVKTLNYTKY